MRSSPLDSSNSAPIANSDRATNGADLSRPRILTSARQSGLYCQRVVAVDMCKNKLRSARDPFPGAGSDPVPPETGSPEGAGELDDLATALIGR
jgi:hypothetical protein